MSSKKEGATKMLTWEAIKDHYRDEWVAMTEWEEDDHGDVVKGNVAYHAHHRNEFYSYINRHFAHRDLAIRFTGNVRGPFLFVYEKH